MNLLKLQLLFVAVVAASNYDTALGSTVFYECTELVPSIATFCENPYDYTCYCRNPNALATITGCFGSTAGTLKYGNSYLQTFCEEVQIPLSMDQIEEAYRNYTKYGYDTSRDKSYNQSEMATTPIKIPEANARLFRNSYRQVKNSLFFGSGAIAYWGFVVVASAVFNWVTALVPQSRHLFDVAVFKVVRRHLTMPALCGKRRTESFRAKWPLLEWLLPTRLETLVVVCFFWLLFILCAVDEKYIPAPWRKQNVVTHTLIADRTGIIATMLTPLMVLFAGRNSFLQFLTRWKSTTMMVFHRWIARMVVLLVLIHAICYTKVLKAQMRYASELSLDYLRYGIVALVCGGIICVQALLYFRRRWYDVFLAIHVVLAVFWVVGSWYHLAYVGYTQVMYAVFAVWAFDRLARFARLCYFGFPRARVTLVEDTLKVEIPKPKHWPTIAGGHIWVHFGLGLHFWQCHPFTFFESETEESTIVCCCKVKGGVTKALERKLCSLPGKQATLRVAVEGPYGAASPVERHSTVLFIAGGSGIPGIYSEANALWKKNGNRQSIKLLWIVRELRSLAMFIHELRALVKHGIETTVFVTRPEIHHGEELEKLFNTDSSSLADNQKEKDSIRDISIIERLQEELPHVEFTCGRPDMRHFVASEVELSPGSVAVVTCGHPLLVDDLRNIVIEQVKTSTKRVDFYEQLQVWA